MCVSALLLACLMSGRPFCCLIYRLVHCISKHFLPPAVCVSLARVVQLNESVNPAVLFAKGTLCARLANCRRRLKFATGEIKKKSASYFKSPVRARSARSQAESQPEWATFSLEHHRANRVFYYIFTEAFQALPLSHFA